MSKNKEEINKKIENKVFNKDWYWYKTFYNIIPQINKSTKVWWYETT
jgi:hypothetical protein